MAAIYNWFVKKQPTETFQLSSALYPIVDSAAYDVTAQLEDSTLLIWPPLEYDNTLAFVGGVLTVTIAWTYYTYRNTAATEQEEYDCTMSFPGGVLTKVIDWVYYTTQEEYDVSMAFMGGQLKNDVGFIYHTQPYEAYDASMAFVNGVLT